MHWGKGEGNLSSNVSETQHEFRFTLNLEVAEGVFIFPNLLKHPYLDLSGLWLSINPRDLAESQGSRTSPSQGSQHLQASSSRARTRQRPVVSS